MADFCAPSEPVLHRGRLPGSKNKITRVREKRESAAAASVAQRAIRQQEKEDAERAANGARQRVLIPLEPKSELEQILYAHSRNTCIAPIAQYAMVISALVVRISMI